MKKLSKIVMTAALTLAACDDPTDLDARDGAAPGLDEEVAGERGVAANASTVVFESVRVVDRDGATIASRESGKLTPEIYQRAARPWSYLDERHIYHEVTRSRELADGQVEHIHQIVREDNPSPVVARPDVTPTRVNAGLTALMADEAMRAAPETMVDVHLRLRDFPDWDIPLLPPATGLSPEDVRRTLADREDAIAARAELLDTYSEALVADLEALGGEVVSRRPSSGWLFVRVPWSSLPRLVEHADVSRVTRPEGFELLWDLGDGRQAGRLDADRFWAAAITGSEPNPGRHSVGRISVGVIDNGFEDEACIFFDGTTCTGTSRIHERFKCHDNPANFCEPLASGTNFAEADEDDHGTMVAGVIAGDFTDDQGCGHTFDDIAGPPPQCHSTAWEQARTGMAPESRLTLFAVTDESTNALKQAQVADAIDDSIDRHLDIINISLDLGAGCNANPVLALEEEAENAYDDGILVVAAAGNNSATAFTTCNMVSPADLIKTIAVNGFNASTAACESDYHTDCTLVSSGSSRGGIDVEVNGVTRFEALSGIDIVAPTGITRTTDAGGSFGEINTSTSGGSSTATPHVSGLAALVKDQHLEAGLTWINSPGRLHTVMLTRTDRHFSTNPANLTLDTQQRAVGADPAYGLGRMKMRLSADMGPWANSFITWSFTSASADKVLFPFGTTPMPAGTTIAKCVMTQAEDMSSKSDISDIDLRLRVRMPDGNGECTSSGTLVATLQDVSFDSKSMVAFESSVATLAGRCLEVTLDKSHVTSAGITTLTSCYHAGQQDDV